MWRRRRPTDDEFRQEVEAHIALETDRLIAEGLRPEEAQAAARRTFGNATRAHEIFYESRHVMWLGDLSRDIQYTLRSLRRAPGFTAVAILTLAIGLGANTAIFSVVNAVLLRPLPYADPDTLVLVEHPPLANSPPHVTAAWRARARSLEDFAGFEVPSAATLLDRGEPVQVNAAQVSWNFFPLLGVSTAIGRGFTEADASADAPAVAVLSHELWRRQFGGDPEVLGRTVMLTGDSLTVVGVMSREFRFPRAPSDERAALVAETQPAVIRVARGDVWLRVLGRLSPGTTPATASEELLAIYRQEAQDQFSASFLERAELTATPLEERLVGDARSRLLLVMGAVGCVLLVACANVANLLLARASSRQPEFAVRAALGARPGRLARLVLTESLLLAMLGSAAALVLAYWTSGLIRSMLADRVSHVPAIPIDWWVLAFNVTLAAAAGVLSGLASIPAVRNSRLASAFGHGGARTVTARTGLRRSLLATEVAVTFVLVVTAALLSQTLWNLHHTQRGFDGDGLLTATVMPAISGPFPQRQNLSSAFFDDLAQRISALPGVESAAAASTVPLGGRAMGMSGVSLIGDQAASGEGESVEVAAVTPGYFGTMRTALLAGRDFNGADLDGAERVAIVNEAFRRRVAPNQPLVGAQIQFGKHPLTVIAIAEDIPDASLREPARPFVYIPLAQTLGGSFAWGRLTILARTRTAAPATLLPAIRQTVWALGHDIVIDEVATMNERVAATVRTERDSALLFGLLAGIALVVAAAGVYGVVAYAVAQRTREIGIRIALGAAIGDVRRLVVAQALWPTLIGIGIGLTGAAFLTRLVASMVFGVTPLDPTAFLVAAAILAAVAMAASYLPSRRATRVDPLAALRCE